MKLNEKIYEYRKINRWSQEELADRLEVSRQTISKWEVGKNIPELEKLIKLAELFKISVDELVKDNIDIVYKENFNDLSNDENTGENFDKEEKRNKKILKKIIEKLVGKKTSLRKMIKIILVIILIIILYNFVSEKVYIFKRKSDVEKISKVYTEQFMTVGVTDSAIIREEVSKKENNVITNHYREYYIYAENGKTLMKVKEFDDKNHQKLIKEIYIDLTKRTHTDWETYMAKYDDVTEVYINDWSSKEIDDYEFITPMDRIQKSLMYGEFDIISSSKSIALNEKNDIQIIDWPHKNVEIYSLYNGTSNNLNREDCFQLFILPGSKSLNFYFDDYKNDIAETREIVKIQLAKVKGNIDDVTVPEL